MLGKYLRLKIAIVLAVVGLVVLGLGIGQRTIWLPPATLTAAVPADVTPAPLSVIGPELLNTRDGQFTLTIKNEGPIQLAVARERDVTAWIGEAAHTQIGGPDPEHATLSAESIAGTQNVPNPAGSDLWVSEEKSADQMTYTWQAPGRGDWALLLSSDGKAPAPTDISITVDNEAGTPWAVPLMVIGSALLALAALLFLLKPRKREPAEAVAGRRAAGRTTSNPATGATAVDASVATRDSGKAVPPANDTVAGGAVMPGELHNPDAVTTNAVTKDTVPAGPDTAKADTAKADKDDSDSDSSGSGGLNVPTGEDTKVERPAKKDSTNDGRNPMTSLRWGAALAAILLAGGAGPAVAADDTASPSAPAASAAAAPPNASAAFPNLVDSQVQRIVEAVSTVVASGDNAKNAKELEPRVAGMALAMRAANYQIRAAVADHPAAEPVSATKLLAKAVSTTEAWPRTAMFVTKGENNELPQLLTLVQETARENYKLIQATPLLPGQTFPSVDQEGTQEVPLDATAGLLMSPKAATEALSDRLTKQDSKFKDSFKDSVYTTSVFDFEKSLLENAKDADYVFSHTVDLNSAVSLRTADGGAMVVVGSTFGTDATSKADAKLTVGEDAAVFTGGRETTKGFTLSYAEPVVMLIPPAGGEKQITILSATRALVGATFK